jgi:hypothetical protein
MRKESMRLKRMWVHKHCFQSKIVLDIPKEEEEDLEEEAKAAPTNQTVNRMKGTGRMVQLAVTL